MYVNFCRYILSRVVNSVLVVATAVIIYIIREKLDERKQKKMDSNGRMTLGIDGKYVMTAEMAKQMIDYTEKQYEKNNISCDGGTDSKGPPQI